MLRQLRTRLKDPSFNEVLCVLAIAAMLSVFFWVAVWVTNNRPAGPGMNFGFGPEWDCKPVGYGEPVCIKRVK